MLLVVHHVGEHRSGSLARCRREHAEDVEARTVARRLVAEVLSWP